MMRSLLRWVLTIAFFALLLFLVVRGASLFS